MKDFCLLVKDQDQSCDSQQGLSFDDKTDGMKQKIIIFFWKLKKCKFDLRFWKEFSLFLSIESVLTSGNLWKV